MLSMFKSDPAKKMQKQYEDKLKQAMLAQRRGDIRAYSMLTVEAMAVREQILALENASE